LDEREDLFSGSCPDEQFRVVINVGDPAADVFFLRFARCGGASFDQLAGEFGEPSINLDDPAEIDWRVVGVEAGVLVQPSFQGGRFVNAVVVADQVHIEPGGDVYVDLAQELLGLHCAAAAHGA
jgi:hypothetical protein